MGEAKRRKASDPNYGRAPEPSEKTEVAQTMRGLVISPPIVIDGENLYVKTSSIDLSELRFSLLYWDKLVWPRSRNISLESNDDETYLEEVGVLSRPDFTVPDFGAGGIAASQIKAFEHLDQLQPGSWAMASGENSLMVNGVDFEQGTGALIDLHRAIPVPTGIVPLDQILEFKLRRKDELLALRQHLDKLILEANASSDTGETLQRQLREIDSACADLLKAGSDWQFPVTVSDLKVSFSLGLGTFTAIAQGWDWGKPYGMAAATASAAMVGLGSYITLQNHLLGFRSVKRPPSPYRYAFKAHEELR